MQPNLGNINTVKELIDAVAQHKRPDNCSQLSNQYFFQHLKTQLKLNTKVRYLPFK